MIKLNELLGISRPDTFKFHAARNDKRDNPLDVYVADKWEWFDWNTWRGSRNDFSRQYILSLIDFYPEKDMWLFGGIYEVLERTDTTGTGSYKIRELDEYSHFVGRLKVSLPKPPRGRAFYLEKYLDNMVVSELLKQPYDGHVFSGYDNVSFDLKQLKPIFEYQKNDWKLALENVKGVYLITDKLTGKKYVGSAYGECGIWSRWNSYVDNGHGGNEALLTLMEENGISYAMEHYKLTLLEYYPMRSSDDWIIARESFYKEALQTRGEHGYNRN